MAQQTLSRLQSRSYIKFSCKTTDSKLVRTCSFFCVQAFWPFSELFFIIMYVGIFKNTVFHFPPFCLQFSTKNWSDVKELAPHFASTFYPKTDQTQSFLQILNLKCLGSEITVMLIFCCLSFTLTTPLNFKLWLLKGWQCRKRLHNLWKCPFCFQNQPLITFGRPKGDGEVRMVSSFDKKKQDRLFYFSIIVLKIKLKLDIRQ